MLLLGYCCAQAFMKTPYDYLDKLLMLAWKPIIKFLIILPLKPIVCGTFGTKLIELGGFKNSLTDA